MTGKPKMIIQYSWILENVDEVIMDEEEPEIIASKMILFRGERVFRVGLKNNDEPPVLFFMAIDLNKIGMKVEEVVYGIQDSCNSPATMLQMKQENIGNDKDVINEEGNLQLFTIDLARKVTGNCTFVFRICIEGSVSGYSYQPSDSLAKDQLWAAASVKTQNSVDVEFMVKNKKLFAHKSILAARSPVFAAEFTSEQPAGDGPVQIRIDDVDPSTVEQFLYFIYTGESLGTLANEDLLKLADKYQLTTLTNLCQLAIKKIKPFQMVNLVKNLNKEAEIPSSSKIRPKKETEIFFDQRTPTFRCGLSLNLAENPPSKSVMQYQNEDIFFAYFTGGVTGANNSLFEPLIHCSCAKHRSFGLKVEDIYCSGKERSQWFKMESKNLKALLHFTTQPPSFSHQNGDEINFDIKLVSTIGSYYYEMMDDAWMNHFWDAANNQKFTDVEIFVGTVQVMEAHRVILSARSPVMSALLGMPGITGKPIVTIDAQFDVDIVKNFLEFLYTGLLNSSTNYKQLLELATTYEVETLKNVCQLANRAPPDVEELTNCLLQL